MRKPAFRKLGVQLVLRKLYSSFLKGEAGHPDSLLAGLTHLPRLRYSLRVVRVLAAGRCLSITTVVWCE